MTSPETSERSDYWLGEADRMLQLLDAGFPPVHEMTAVEARSAVAARIRPVDNEDDVRSAEDRLVDGSLRVRVYRPRGGGAGSSPAVLFLHGGGFVFCSIESHDGFCRRMSRHTSSVVVSVDYRLAPEHRAPAAAEDAFAAFRWMLLNAAELGVDPARVVVAGDSAGGNLAAVTCLMARDGGASRPAGQVLLYPVVAPDFDTDSYRRYATGCFNTLAAMRWYWRHYLDGEVLPTPAEYAAPLHAPSHVDLPPAIVVTAGRDPLCTEGERYAARLRSCGVPVRHRHYPDMFHGFATIAGFGPAAAAQELLWRDIEGLFNLGAGT